MLTNLLDNLDNTKPISGNRYPIPKVRLGGWPWRLKLAYRYRQMLSSQIMTAFLARFNCTASIQTLQVTSYELWSDLQGFKHTNIEIFELPCTWPSPAPGASPPSFCSSLCSPHDWLCLAVIWISRPAMKLRISTDAGWPAAFLMCTAPHNRSRYVLHKQTAKGAAQSWSQV